MSHKACLGNLEPELIALILELVDDASPSSTRAVACVNRYFNQVTRVIAHRHKTLQIDAWVTEHDVRLINSWSLPEVLPHIRTLTVKGWIDPIMVLDDPEQEHNPPDDDEGTNFSDEDEDDDEDDEQTSLTKINDGVLWRALIAFIPKIGRLRLLDWNVKYPLPVQVFEALQQQRFATLRIFNFTRKSINAQTLDPIELLLADSPALTHIRHVSDNIYLSTDVREIAFRGIVGSAPNLEYAGLIQRSESLSLAESRARLTQWTPAFYKHQRPSTSVRRLTLDGVPITKQNLDDWSLVIDLSQLENVKFTRGMPSLDYIKSAPTLLPNLKNLSLNLRSIADGPQTPEKVEKIAAIQDYIVSCSPLETLSLWSWMDVVPLSDILTRHGATLRSLQLHEREVPHQDRKILTVDQVQAIREICPNLKDFTFDLKRRHPHLIWETDENKNCYEELARFPKLDSLQIYLDVGAAYVYTALPVRYRDYNTGYSYDEASDEDQSESEDEDQDGEKDQQQQSSSTGTTDASLSTVSSSNTALPLPNVVPDTVPDTNNSPPSKKRKRTSNPKRLMRPSRDNAYRTYVKRIWTTIFRHNDRSWGGRNLDVKVGEWESKNVFNAGIHSRFEHQLKRHLIVRPNERDDIEEPTCKLLTARM